MRDWTPEIQYQAECNAGMHNYAAAEPEYDTGDEKEDDELTDEQLEEYKQTQEYADWMMENAGNGDWVAYEEENYDLIFDMAIHWFERN